MKSLGIDIGSSSIKIVEVNSTSKGFQVSQYFEHGLNVAPGADQDLEIIEFLRSFLSRYDASQTRFVLGLRQDRVAVRNKFFPFNERLKITKSLAFELEEDLPFSSDNAIFDAKIIKTVGPGAEVLACAAPKQHVQSALSRARDLGVEPYVISAEGISFANVFEKWNEAPPATVAPPLSLDGEANKPLRHVRLVINMGHTRTLVCAFEGQSLIGIRSLLWGGRNIAEAIAKKYEIPFLDALRELQTKAFILTNKQGATFDQVTFSDTIAKSVRELARDLQLSILEIRSEFNAQVHDIGMTGGVSLIQNLGPFMTQTLEIPCNRISSLEQIPHITFERNAVTDAKAGVALGLALEAFKKPRNPALNFLRQEFAQENVALKVLWEKWGFAIKVAAASLALFFIHANLRDMFSLSLADRAQEALVEQAKTVANLKGKNATESGIRKYIRDNKKRASDLKTLSSVASMNSALDILKKINDAVPAKNAVTLEVQILNVADNQVRLQGYVNSPKEVSLLQQALTNISDKGLVKNQASNLTNKVGKTTFSFMFNVDRGIQKVIK